VNQRIFSAVLPGLSIGLLSLLLTPTFVRADAASDLADGQAAMQQASLDAALPLLAAAAEALPDSVEAQLALAECHLRLGQLDQALAHFQAVVRLSPEHKRAGQMVATLSGRNASVDERIAAAELLMSVGAWEQAARLLADTLTQPQESEQRNKVRLLLAQSRLWFGTMPTALGEALQLMQDSQDAALVGPARVIAALALIQLARASGEPSAISAKLASSLNTVPGGGLRHSIVQYASKQLFDAAQAQLGKSDQSGTLAIVWPMLSNQPVPQADAVMQPVEVTGGWLIGPRSSSGERLTLTQILTGIGRSEVNASGRSASLLGYWLAAQVLWQSPVVDADAVKSLLNTSGQIGALSRPAPGRQKGTILSRADDVQAAMLIALARFAVTEEQRKQVVAQMLVQVDRYGVVDDLATGLLQFGIADGLADLDIDFARAPVTLPPGEAHRTLLVGLGARHAAIGASEFQKSRSAVLRDPDAALDVHDSVALTMFSLVVGQYPADATATKAADKIVARYTTADEWTQASQALTLFYAGQAGVDGRWAQVRLAIRQAARTEERLLAARRTIGAALSEQITEALVAAVAIVNESATPVNRQIAIQIAGSLASRYAGLQRDDLSGSVIAAVGEGDAGAASLADWSIWMRAGLLEIQAARTLASTATRTDDRGAIAINEQHAAELKLLSGLITLFPQSEYAAAAVNQVLAISVEYQSYRAFDSASAVLTGFLEAQPKLTTAAQIEYQVVGISVSKALASFQERPDKVTPPTELTADHAAAIQALAAYLQKYPTGDQAPAAEDQLFSIARTYGEAGGWPVVRDVLAKFAAAVPNFRSPSHLQLLSAATWLGELDPQQGLALLTPTPPQSAERSLRDNTELGQIMAGGLIAKYDDVNEGSGPVRFGGVGGGGGGFASAATKLPGGKPGDSPPPGTPKPGTRRPPVLNAIPQLTPQQAAELPASRPSGDSLAMIRESQARQFQRIAMLEGFKDEDEEGGEKEGKGGARTATGVVLPSGTVLSEAEITRQNDAADNAYAILIKLVLDQTPQNAAISVQARTHIMWMFGFFEGQVRPDRAIVLIRKYLADNPEDQERVALAYRALTDRFVQVSKRQPAELIDQEWVNARHQQFEQARGEIADFIEAWAGKAQWVNAARLLIVESYERESQLVAPFNRERAGGLLVQSAEAVLNLWQTAPGHPDAPGFPNRLWGISEQLANGGLNEAAIEVLRWISNHFPTSDLAAQSTLRIAQLYASSLSNPVRAVETYHEYLSLNEGDASVPTEIFGLAQQLGSQQRYLEALHVYGVFVDSFPTDARAAPALHAIGNTHQANGVWEDAITAYERVVEDYAGTEIIPQTRLDVAECRINLGEWATARGLYEDFLDEYPKHAQAPMARTRIDVLKQLGRFQDLLTDDDVDRNKDDAQFQIGRTVLTQLQNPIKAVEEFRKVVSGFANSDVADDAQLEIGRSLLSLGRMDDGRAELLKVPQLYPGSALADDALFLLAASYEQQAQALAAVTQEKARYYSNLAEQQMAYARFNRRGKLEKIAEAQTRDMIKEEGDAEKLALNDAFAAFRYNTSSVGQLFCEVTQAEQMTESETALQIANRRDRINDAYREAVVVYSRAATDYPLGDRTDQSLLKIAEILETRLKDGAAAMQTYQRIVKLFPGTPVAEDAAWKVARFQVEEGRYAAAADAFQTFIRNYPGSTRVADAQFGRAEVLEQLGRWNEAMDAYEVFRQKFNKHPKVTLAAQQITWIKTYRK
jgi:TolA-binding protein